ncbi:hypothetical protein KMP13_00610 [Epibacterium ulvae]|uniref:hypothetical protein n=1 Tax=Epibacterium ulvae TaxID=1156985 RepID=UPI001BFC2CC6|nr:hypothetical protein [Epibacterium ulvae]MBT8152421.1 hypothetical protein [Epibacterium ulvae]
MAALKSKSELEDLRKQAQLTLNTTTQTVETVNQPLNVRGPADFCGIVSPISKNAASV